jgi:hypothetical protein
MLVAAAVVFTILQAVTALVAPAEVGRADLTTSLQQMEQQILAAGVVEREAKALSDTVAPAALES